MVEIDIYPGAVGEYVPARIVLGSDVMNEFNIEPKVDHQVRVRICHAEPVVASSPGEGDAGHRVIVGAVTEENTVVSPMDRYVAHPAVRYEGVEFNRIVSRFFEMPRVADVGKFDSQILDTNIVGENFYNSSFP